MMRMLLPASTAPETEYESDEWIWIRWWRKFIQGWLVLKGPMSFVIKIYGCIIVALLLQLERKDLAVQTGCARIRRVYYRYYKFSCFFVRVAFICIWGRQFYGLVVVLLMGFNFVDCVICRACANQSDDYQQSVGQERGGGFAIKDISTFTRDGMDMDMYWGHRVYSQLNSVLTTYVIYSPSGRQVKPDETSSWLRCC